MADDDNSSDDKSWFLKAQEDAGEEAREAIDNKEDDQQED